MGELPVLNHKGPVEGNKHNWDNHGLQKAFDTSSCLISPDCENAIERMVQMVVGLTTRLNVLSKSIACYCLNPYATRLGFVALKIFINQTRP